MKQIAGTTTRNKSRQLLNFLFPFLLLFVTNRERTVINPTVGTFILVLSLYKLSRHSSGTAYYFLSFLRGMNVQCAIQCSVCIVYFIVLTERSLWPERMYSTSTHSLQHSTVQYVHLESLPLSALLRRHCSLSLLLLSKHSPMPLCCLLGHALLSCL